MRISSDKVNKLAHTVADTLAEIDECDFMEDRNTIRQEARKALEKLLAEETKLDANARLKIASQRKIILEGSQEWDILYRKYYNDEVTRYNTTVKTFPANTVAPVLGFAPEEFFELKDLAEREPPKVSFT